MSFKRLIEIRVLLGSIRWHPNLVFALKPTIQETQDTIVCPVYEYIPYFSGMAGVFFPGVNPVTICRVRQEMAALDIVCWETSIGGYGVIQHFELNGHFNLPKTFTESSKGKV